MFVKKILLPLLLSLTSLLSVFADSENPDIFDTYLLKTGHTGTINSVTRQKNTLVSSSSDKTIRLWNLETGELIDAFSFRQNLTSALLTEDGRNLLVTDSSDRIFKVDVASGLTVAESKEHFQTYLSGCQPFLWGSQMILINNKYVLALNTETMEKIWLVEMDKVFPESWGHDWHVTRKDDQLLFTDGKSIGWINLSDGTLDVRNLSMEAIGYRDYLWPLDKDLVLNNEYRDMFYYTAADTGMTRFSDLRGEIHFTGGSYFAVTNDAVHLFDRELKEVNTLHPDLLAESGRKIFFPDRETLAVTSSRGDLYFYADPSAEDSLPLVLGEVKISQTDLMVSADRKGQFFTAQKGGKTVRSWQTSNGNPRKIYELDEPVRFLSLNKAQDTLFVGTEKSLRVVNTSSMTEKNRREAEGEIRGMAYSEALDALVSYEYTNTEQSLKIWQWKKKDSPIESVSVEKGYRNDALYSLDETHLLLTDGNDFYECYDMNERTRVWERKESVSTKRDIYYAMEEGKFLLIKADGRIYRETSPGVLAESAELGNFGHRSFLLSADLSSEASVLAAGTSDGRLLYFDWNSYELTHEIETGDHLISRLSITDKRYGRQLLFTNETGALCHWTKINDKWKFLSYPLGESALVLKPSRGEVSPNFYGHIEEEDRLFLARTRPVPGIRESRWEFRTEGEKPVLKILCGTENIPDGTVLEVRINQCNSQGDLVKEAVGNLTAPVNGGKAELTWSPVDTREANEISDLWFVYTIDSSYTAPLTGEPVRVTYPEIQESFWYCDRAASGDPAILSLVVKDLDPKEDVTLEFFETPDRKSSAALMEGFRIGEMEDPIVINNQRFSHAGLKKGTAYYITLHTAGGLDFPVPEPVSYQ